MADAASIARRELRAVRSIADMLEEKGGPKARKRLETARKKSRKNRALMLEAVADVTRDTLGGMVPDTTPIDGLLGMHPEVEKLLKKNGIKTKHDARMASDAELLSISGIGPGTLKRIRDNL